MHMRRGVSLSLSLHTYTYMYIPLHTYIKYYIIYEYIIMYLTIEAPTKASLMPGQDRQSARLEGLVRVVAGAPQGGDLSSAPTTA